MQGVRVTVERTTSGGLPRLVKVQFDEHLFTTGSAAAWWAAHKAELEQQYRLGRRDSFDSQPRRCALLVASWQATRQAGA